MASSNILIINVVTNVNVPARFLHTLDGMKQTTIKRSVTIRGTGLHSGQPATLTILPSYSGKGLVFRRMDAGRAEVPAAPRFLQSTNYATRLARNGVRVDTVEHVLAALYACGIDNAVLELDGPEVPSLDGSSEPFVVMLGAAGRIELPAERTRIRILKPVSLLEEDKSIVIYPARGFHVTYSIEFDHPLLKFQKHSIEITSSTFASEIAPARTFGFLRDVEALRKVGLARGGSLENAVVIGDDQILNSELRFDNECVRHKILDLVGDFALLGCHFDGHVVAHKGGHHIHTDFLRKLLATRGAYELLGSEPAVSLPDLVASQAAAAVAPYAPASA